MAPPSATGRPAWRQLPGCPPLRPPAARSPDAACEPGANAILLAFHLALVGAIAWEGTAVLETAMGLVRTELPALKSLSKVKVAVVEGETAFYEYHVTRNRDKFVERHRYNRSRIEEGLRTAKARFPQHGLVPVIEGQYAEIVDKAARLEASLAPGMSPEEAPRLIREPGQFCGDAAAALGEDILSSFRRPVAAAGREFHVGPSIGIALLPRDGRDPSEIIKKADAAMHQARQHGGGRYVGQRGAQRRRPGAAPAGACSARCPG
jgi:hypothetical protein